MNGNKAGLVCAITVGVISTAGLVVALTGGKIGKREELPDIVRRMERAGVVKTGVPTTFELRHISNGNLPVATAIVFPDGDAKVEHADFPVAIYDCRGRGTLARDQFMEAIDIGHAPYRTCQAGYVAMFGEFVVVARNRQTLDVFADYLE